MKEKNILFYGMSTYENRGCEAIAVTLASQIKRKNKESKITCAVFDYENCKDMHKELIDKHIKHYKNENELTEEEQKRNEHYKQIQFDYNNFEQLYQNEIIKSLEKMDLCFSIGGDNYCYGFNSWLYAINNYIRDKHKVNILFGASLFEKIEDPELINELNKYDLLVIRESISYNAIKDYVDPKRLLLLPDPAFSLESEKVDINYNLSDTIGINISPIILESNGEKLLSNLEAFINYIIENTSYNIALIPHVYNKDNNDLEAIKLLKNRFLKSKKVFTIDDRKYNCKELKYIISKLKFLIAARTHASIAAYSSCVPTLVIGYSVKSKGIAQDLFGNYKDYVISKEELTLEKLIEKFKFIEKNENEIRNTLNTIMPDIKEKSNNLYEIILKKLEELYHEFVISGKECTGCTACYNICPFNAIEMKENEEGFLEPKIILDKCTQCGLCKKTCPVLNEEIKNNQCIEAHAAINKNKNVQETSSSGGIFSILSEYIINKLNGIIYGAYLDGSKVSHIRIDNIKDLEKLKGSKYLQSNLSDTFKKVKQDLENNEEVLFSGTPCQIAGLKSYLKKDYNNLLTVSVICHGIPSPLIFEKYLNTLGQNIKDYNFRDKRAGWENYKISYKIADEKFLINPQEDLFMKSFQKDLDLRYCCYNCKFKYDGKNCADIILGDYWGIYNEHKEFFDEKGVSAIILESEKGIKMFNEIKQNTKFINTEIEKIIKGNPSLISSAPLTMPRIKFFKTLKKNTLIDTIEKHYLEKEILDLNKQLKILEKENTDLKEKNNYLNNKIDGLDYELKSILNSKRWQYSDKIANLLKFKSK